MDFIELCPLCYGEPVVVTTGSIRFSGGDVQDDIEEYLYCPSCKIKIIKGVLDVKKKVSESEFVRFAKLLGMQPHKFADRMKCNTCGCLIWKSNKMPDYEVTYLGLKTLVEVKQSNASGRWSFANNEQGVRDTQVEEMNAWEENHKVDCWMFIVLGAGRAPVGRGAFLLPWKDWKRIEAELITDGQKSIVFEGGRQKSAVDVLRKWQLNWVHGDWALPVGHAFNNFIMHATLASNLRMIRHDPAPWKLENLTILKPETSTEPVASLVAV